jgi:hypothetical protein
LDDIPTTEINVFPDAKWSQLIMFNPIVNGRPEYLKELANFTHSQKRFNSELWQEHCSIMNTKV